jgi:alkanesulfonate monooxygenase SsuD/methylene tetrahydromethanopterin reductase-like flavin-dependent oxidoreductase (luciferase family)
MMAMDPYPGYEGKYFSMPCRNVVPKPVQKPHPPIWVACSNRETIKLAAKLGIGALTFAFVDPTEAKQWVDDYYRILKTECVPVGHAVNANVAMVTGFSCHRDEQEAIRRGLDGFNFFGYALGHHYIFGEHKPGRTNIWERFEQARGSLPDTGRNRGIGTPEHLRKHLRGFADAGVDQVTFIQQGGKNRHDHICESLKLFAAEVMPEFHAEEAARQRKKEEELAPFIAAAMKRKQWMKSLADEDIPLVRALGRQIAEVSQGVQQQGGGGGIAIPAEDPARR